MITDNDELMSALNNWIKDHAILEDTRKFLRAGSGQGAKRSGALGDGQIANWRRRESLPEAFVQGAALYHCAHARNAPLPAAGQKAMARQNAIEGDEFWQVFILDPAKDDKQPMIGCTILRAFQGIRAHHRGTSDWFTHAAYRSAAKTAESAKQDVPRALVEDDSFRRIPDADGAVVVSWRIGAEPRDQGYQVSFPNSIAKNRPEAVGGCPTIPVASSHLLAYFPRSLRDRHREMRQPSNPLSIPSVISLLPVGNPVRVMESYLGIHDIPTEEDFLRIAPWFQQEPLAEPWKHDSHRVPQLIREHEAFKEAEGWVHEDKYEAFATHVDAPLPFLSYFMIFGNRSEGVSNG